MALLVLVRHGQSVWNAKGLWTGLMDIPLSDKGEDEAKHTGLILKNYKFDVAFTSTLKRAQQTLDILLKESGQQETPIIKSAALNERDYGIYTGKNKWEVEKKIGGAEFLKIRRSWDFPIPKGESLRQVSERVYPYYVESILPFLKEHKNVLIAAHGNSIRALIKHLDNVSDDKAPMIEVTTGEADIYTMDEAGNVIRKERMAVNKTEA